MRPRPPEELERSGEMFLPAPEVGEWVREQVLEQDGKLWNDEHGHLLDTDIGWLWTNVEGRRRGRMVLGTAEIPRFRGTAWVKARQELQMRQWFGSLPDFVITLDAPWSAEARDPSWCALVEHELYHCGQAVDEWGAPRFREDGTPVWTIVGHDVEEFVGVVRRYGARAAGMSTELLARAASEAPEVAESDVLQACGTCRQRTA